MNSRFNRQSSPSSDKSSSAPAPSTSSHKIMDNDIDMGELQRRLQQAQEKRMRQQFELEQTKRQIEECVKAAEKFGVTNLEELETLVRTLEEQDRQNMETFMKELQEEEQKLAHIEQELQRLDSSGAE